MNELRALVHEFDAARSRSERCALATVVHVEGSAYRRPGARMIVTDTGRTTGVISGGCLDGDVRERAATVMRTGRPVLVKYDTTTDDDIVWGLGLGCNGIVHVLIEPATDGTDDLMRFLEACSRAQGPSAFATVIRSESAGLPLGARVLLSSDGRASLVGGTRGVAGARGVDVITQEIVGDLHAALSSGVSSLAHYGVDAQVQVFVEVLAPPVLLVVFGAGADAVPLVTAARNLGWHTTVVDTQARVRSIERFKEADAVILCRPEEVAARVTLTETSVAVLMTHNYLHDVELLPVLLNSRARYIGCLGPKRRTERLLSELRDDTRSAHDHLPGRLYAPIGLDVGAENPSEIAVSIVAEILSVIGARSGGPLRHRQGSIHGGTLLNAAEDVTAVGDVLVATNVACQPASA